MAEGSGFLPLSSIPQTQSITCSLVQEEIHIQSLQNGCGIHWTCTAFVPPLSQNPIKMNTWTKDSVVPMGTWMTVTESSSDWALGPKRHFLLQRCIWPLALFRIALKLLHPRVSPNLASFILALRSLWIKSKERLLLCVLFTFVGREKACVWILLPSTFSI